MLIELIGASGVGKTTALNSFIKKHHNLFKCSSSSIELNEEELRFYLDFFDINNFLNEAIKVISHSAVKPTQKISAIQMLFSTSKSYITCMLSSKYNNADRFFVEDELLLHRSFAILACVDMDLDVAQWYFNNVPIPDAVVFMSCSSQKILYRYQERSHVVNSYRHKSDQEILDLLDKSHNMYGLAISILRKRGVEVITLVAEEAPEDVFFKFEESLLKLRENIYIKGVVERLRVNSTSFRKKNGRHSLSSQNLIYCSFDMPFFKIDRDLAQRSAMERFDQFSLDSKIWHGASVLDLGCNNGAMLLQASNHLIQKGLGIEFDFNKVELANEISSHFGLGQLEFVQGDIDELSLNALGVFDIVFALAIERHVNDPEALYHLLGQVTGKVLCFEGNSGCDVESVINKLRKHGFQYFEYRGFCKDDIVPANNTRPVLIAFKDKQ